MKLPIAALLSCLLLAQNAPLATVVRTNPARADAELKRYLSLRGVTSEYIEALSWQGRAFLAAGNCKAAEANAAEVRKLALEQLSKRKLDGEPSLPVALGASIEVQSQCAAAQGRRDEAVTFLRAELKRWAGTSILTRIQKNLNLLTLEGKPAPVLDVQLAATSRKPQSLLQHRGHPVLLFFWAHWCSDCKAEVPVIAKLAQIYGPRGLVVMAPTQHYGYVAGGTDAPANVEETYIKSIFEHYYAELGSVEAPLSEQNFARYGVSTTPTIVLIDGAGIVRLYNPGNLDYRSLATRIEALLKR